MKKRLIKIVLLNTLIVIISLIYYFLNKYFNIGIPCLFYQITGLKCPGCGITRLIFSLIKLDFRQAFFYNPLVFILLPFIGFYIIYQEYLYITKKEDKIIKKIPSYIYYLLIIILIIYAILRNIFVF